MSRMLEQAIEDAKTLKDAAFQMAERQIVEKYSDDVRKACDRLIEGDMDDLDLGFGDELDAAPGEDLSATSAVALSPEDEAVIDNIPAAYGPESTNDDDMIELDLNDIKHVEEEVPGEPIDRAELAQDIGIPGLEDEEALETEPAEEELELPANRDDDEEIEVNETELANLFSEMLAVDAEIPPQPVEEEKAKDELEAEEEENPFPLAVNDGIDAKDREITELKTQLESASKRNNKLTEVLGQAKDRLEEINLSNARLYYINRVVTDTSYNERQKAMFAETISKAGTVGEAKVIYETLHKTSAVKTKRGQVPESLSEAITRSSSTVIGSNRGNEMQADPTRNRWAKLAGLAAKQQ
jgi:hypothetical protein